MPLDSSAQPQCMLQDIDRGAYCGLLCQVDAQCPSGSHCRQIKQVDVGLCLYPVAFADWAKQGSTKKLAIGWPTRKEGSSAGNFQMMISKTFGALQNLKSKYSIDDGDGDMVTLKELLNSLSAPTSGPRTSGTVALAPSDSESPTPAPTSHQGGTVYGAWHHDIATFGKDLSRGLPGIQDEIHGVVHHVEHITERGAASTLLRGLIWFTVVYVAVGSAIKYQMMGARGIDMIPHIGFWIEYPKLVNDGVEYTKILLGGAIGAPKTGHDVIIHGGTSRSGGSGNFEVL